MSYRLTLKLINWVKYSVRGLIIKNKRNRFTKLVSYPNTSYMVKISCLFFKPIKWYECRMVKISTSFLNHRNMSYDKNINLVLNQIRNDWMDVCKIDKNYKIYIRDIKSLSPLSGSEKTILKLLLTFNSLCRSRA